MDRYGAYNEEEWRYGRREYDEEARHYQGRTRQEFQCQICGEHGHIALSCRLYHRRHQEVCNACGNYGHSSYTCPRSRGNYNASAYEEYNKQEVYQRERWNDHRPNSQDLGWKDTSYVSPHKLEEFFKMVEEFTKDGDDSFDRFPRNYLQSMQRFMARQQIPQSLEDKWQKTIAFVNKKIKSPTRG